MSRKFAAFLFRRPLRFRAAYVVKAEAWAVRNILKKWYYDGVPQQPVSPWQRIPNIFDIPSCYRRYL